MNATMTDAAQIKAKIDGYVQGCQTGDETHFKASFHPDAQMFGGMDGARYDMPIVPGLSGSAAENPTGDHDATILSIDIVGDAACVKLAESRFWGQDFVDFFLLSKIDGDWQIVAKTFAHTGPSA